jgi:hypothetical protein
VHHHESLRRLVVHGDRLHESVARVRAVARANVDVQGVEAVRAVVAITAAGERVDPHAALLTGERRVLGVPGDGPSSRVEVIFDLERPRVPSALPLGDVVAGAASGWVGD